jgi:hypothetical protein
MRELTPAGRQAADEIARRTGFSSDAVLSMLVSIAAGGGRMAQFDHPEFGQSGQWMAGGPIMISDMFNNPLKARVAALCSELAILVRNNPWSVAMDSARSQSQRASSVSEDRRDVGDEAPAKANWWPSGLGVPSSVGSQNSVRYAYFPAVRRIAIELDEKMTVYDTQDHQITGFSQQQPSASSPSFSSQLGAVDLSSLPVVTPEGPSMKSDGQSGSSSIQQRPAEVAAAKHDEILTTIERLADLNKKGVLSDAEFSAKKAELLNRL